MRTVVLTVYRVALAISGISLLYLLFIFGHTETAPLGRVAAAAAVAGASALVAGVLQWVGLPTKAGDDGANKSDKSRSARRSR